MSNPVTYERFRVACSDGSIIEARLGDQPRHTIRVDRPRAETHVELGLRIFWQRHGSADFECVSEYWAGYYFKPDHESRIAGWLKQWETDGAKAEITLDDFLETLEAYLAQESPPFEPRAPLEGRSAGSSTHARAFPAAKPGAGPPIEVTFETPGFARRMEPIDVSIAADKSILISSGQGDNLVVLRIQGPLLPHRNT